VPLKPKAYDLLTVLLSNRDRVLGKEVLLDWLWPRQVIGG
jgi:DNA-binding winged helix-turn-helix (wHTH) protein